MRTRIKKLGAAMAAVAAALSAQTEGSLKAAFENKQVVLKVDMPAASRGIDVLPQKLPKLDFRELNNRLKTYGTAISKGSRTTVTAVKVNGKFIEFQLDGGGFGARAAGADVDS